MIAMAEGFATFTGSPTAMSRQAASIRNTASESPSKLGDQEQAAVGRDCLVGRLGGPAEASRHGRDRLPFRQATTSAGSAAPNRPAVSE